MKRIFLCILMLMNGVFLGAENHGVGCYVSESVIPFHQLTPCGPIPSVYDPDGVYPYMSYSETSKRPFPQKYRTVVLENEYIVATICPDLCGKVMSLIHKHSGKETLYVPGVIKGTRILPRFYFTAGGIEVSFPISHSPTQNDPVQYSIIQNPDRTYVCCGEREKHFGLQWLVEYSLGPDDDFLTERVVYYNPGRCTYPWMSWSNAAIPCNPDTHYCFPNGEVLSHASELKTIDWEREGTKYERDIKEMTGYFWQTSDVNAFGAFTPSLGVGLFHVADEKSAPGIKLWSYGVEADREWSMLSTPVKQPYVELQGGPARDQSIKLELEGGEKRSHVEFWIPTDRELDIRSLKVPDVQLRGIDEIELFGWTDSPDISFWTGFAKAYECRLPVPQAPSPMDCLWAPSGMEDLSDAFLWATATSKGKQRDNYMYYYGVWLAGRERIQEAIAVLSDCTDDLAKAVKARLLFREGDIDSAVQTYRSVPENSYLNLIPQFICERDLVLSRKGKETITEREAYFNRVSASDDEWICERMVHLLMDKGQYAEAEQLLMSIDFQKVHQTYTRTDAWKQIRAKLKKNNRTVPESLGEDRLARFGAYREYEEQ